jgi:predicted nucleic acid-binding protein
MRAVLDTNVLISGVISTGITPDVLDRGFRGEFDIDAYTRA